MVISQKSFLCFKLLFEICEMYTAIIFNRHWCISFGKSLRLIIFGYRFVTNRCVNIQIEHSDFSDRNRGPLAVVWSTTYVFRNPLYFCESTDERYLAMSDAFVEMPERICTHSCANYMYLWRLFRHRTHHAHR